MLNKNSKQLHETYHATTKRQIKIINSKNFTYRLIIHYLDKYLKNKPRKSVLDIGSGAGTLSFYLASQGHDVVGIDISNKAVKESTESAKQLDLENVIFKQSNFPNKFNFKNKFDAIIFTEVIEHLEDDNLALKKINLLLKKDGLLFLSTPSIEAPLHRLGLTKKFDDSVGHLRRYNIEQLRKLLTMNGFEIQEVKKTEGIVRNFLFVNPYAGKLVRYVNFAASDLTTALDNLSLKLFGNSNFIIIARKK